MADMVLASLDRARITRTVIPGCALLGADPESRSYLPLDSGFARSARPGMTSDTSAREGAAVLFFGRRDHFQVLVRAGHRRARGEDVPLVLDLVGGQRGHRIHFMHELMIRAAEVTLPRLQEIELGALLEMLDDFWRFDRLQIVDRLRHDLCRD